MNKLAQAAIAAAAVLVVAVLGYNLLPRTRGVGGRQSPAPTTAQPPSPSPSLAATSTPGTATVTPFAPGRFEVCPPAFSSSDCIEDPRDDSMAFTFDVPAGWQADHAGAALADEGLLPPGGANVQIARGNWLYSDPCRPHSGGFPDVEVGPTVADLVTALDTHTLPDVTTPVDVTLAGYSGKYLELQVPSDISECAVYRPLEGTLYAQGPGQLWRFWIFDFDGIRVVVLTYEYPGTSTRHRAELLAIVDSIEVTP